MLDCWNPIHLHDECQRDVDAIKICGHKRLILEMIAETGWIVGGKLALEDAVED